MVHNYFYLLPPKFVEFIQFNPVHSFHYWPGELLFIVVEITLIQTGEGDYYRII